MNKSSIAGIFNGAVLVAILIALISPNTSWADDHLLSINGATVTTPATVTHAGAVIQPLVLSSFDGNTPLTLGQSQNLIVVSALLKMCKPGTNNQLEWLDQGNTVVGVTGTLTSGASSLVPDNGYRLTLTMTGISDTYNNSNGSCAVSGQKTYTFTAGALLEQQTGGSGTFTPKPDTTSYNFWNATNSVPEPGTMLLMLVGLLVLIWMSMKRMRAVRNVSA